MKNLTKGFFTTLIGSMLILFAILDFFGAVSFDSPEGVSDLEQVIYAGVAGIILFFVPASKIEEKVTSVFSKKADNL